METEKLVALAEIKRRREEVLTRMQGCMTELKRLSEEEDNLIEPNIERLEECVNRATFRPKKLMKPQVARYLKDHLGSEVGAFDATSIPGKTDQKMDNTNAHFAGSGNTQASYNNNQQNRPGPKATTSSQSPQKDKSRLLPKYK